VRNILQAKLLGDQIGLEALPALLSIYVGWRVGGFWGALLCPVLLSAVQQLNDRGVIRLWKTV
jgi:predicted PurR-regulated permease PerM